MSIYSDKLAHEQVESNAYIPLHLSAPVKIHSSTFQAQRLLMTSWAIYAHKLAHIQVVINCLHFVAPFCTGEDTLAYISGVPTIDDVMSYNSLRTQRFN